jgi:hypothetical protein
LISRKELTLEVLPDTLGVCKLDTNQVIPNRANAILGLAHIATTKRKLEKYIVKPVILRALREEKDYEWRIVDAIKDINLFMRWNIGTKAYSRMRR